jgi:peptidoglycan hydrolase CwlO-like protein
MKTIFGKKNPKVDGKLKDLQTQLNFIDGQILQTKQLVHQLNGIIANHQTNKKRIETEMDKIRKAETETN